MNFFEMMQTRQSCRSYQDKPVSREDLMKLVEVGRLSPSGCNSQPWKFIVVDDPEAKALMGDALTVEDGKTGCAWWEQVPAFIILCEQEAKLLPMCVHHYKDTQRFAQGDIGGAAMNMCHQAMELGLDTCIIGLNDQTKMERNFGIPAGHEVRIVLAVGYGADPQRKKVRKPLEEVCSFNHW